jgi:hypothetical protein
MRKLPLTAALLAACALSLAGQEGGGKGEVARIGSFSQSYALINFPKVTIEDNKICHVAKYDEEMFGYTETDEQYNILGSLGGVPNVIDRSTELVASAAILNRQFRRREVCC